MGVGAVVFKGDRVLLIRRGKPPLMGRWVVPGGTVEFGETLLEAVVREIKEETGLDVRPREQVALVEAFSRNGKARYHFVIADYLCEVTGGRLRAGTDALEAAFVPLRSLGLYRVPLRARQVIAEARKRKKLPPFSPSGISTAELTGEPRRGRAR